jgi:ubiquinone biosynthesis protein UbiJ
VNGAEPLLHLFERAVNHCLRYDPDSLGRLSAIEGRQIAIELTGTAIVVFVCPYEGRLELRASGAPRSDVVIRATPLDLMLAAGGRAAGVEIAGDAATAQHLQAVLAGLDIDWEEMVATITGDVVAHQLGNVARDLSEWLRQARRTLEMDASEYLRYEQALMPEPSDVERFNREVETLRDDVARLEARLLRLERGSAGSRR